MADKVEKPGWVPYEQFIEHLKLFPVPCVDLLVDIKGKGRDREIGPDNLLVHRS